MRFFQIFTTHFHLLAPPLNKEFFIKSPPPPSLYWHPFPTTLLCVIVGGGSNCKCWGKKPQVHLIIIKEWPKSTLILRILIIFPLVHIKTISFITLFIITYFFLFCLLDYLTWHFWRTSSVSLITIHTCAIFQYILSRIDSNTFDFCQKH